MTPLYVGVCVGLKSSAPTRASAECLRWRAASASRIQIRRAAAYHLFQVDHCCNTRTFHNSNAQPCGIAGAFSIIAAMAILASRGRLLLLAVLAALQLSCQAVEDDSHDLIGK